MNTKEIIENHVSFKNKTRSKKIVELFIDDCVENIVNNYGCFLPNGIRIEAVLVPLQYKKKKYYAKEAMYQRSELKETVNPFYPNHYLNVRASGLPIDIHGIKFKAHAKVARACSKKCFSGKYYKEVSV